MSEETLDIDHRTVKTIPAPVYAFPGNLKPLQLDVILYEEHDDRPVPAKKITYCFAPATEKLGDVVQGKIPQTDRKPYIHLGTGLSKHFYRSHDNRTIPVDVLSELADKNITLLKGVDGGWHTWEGRPEWSDTYVDFTEAHAIDIESIIDERMDE